MKCTTKVMRTATVASSLDWFLRGQLKFLNQHFNVIALSGDDFHLKQVKEREGVKTIVLKFERRISLYRDLKALFKLFLILKKEKPTIIHSVTPKAGLLSMIAGYYAGVPIRFHTFTGLYFPHKRGLIQRISIFTDKLLCRHATAIFPEGKGVMNDLINYKITNKSLNIIANGNVNGIDTLYFNPVVISEREKSETLEKLSLKKTDFVFIYTGRLVADKGINILITAFSNLNKKYKHSKLILVGDYESDIDPLEKSIIEEIVSNKNILMMGFQNDVRPYLSISNVHVLPSFREGFPNSVLEAGAMQIPSIVTNVSGSNEIIINQHNGWIIKKKDSKILEKSLKDCLNQKKANLDQMSINARNNIEDRFKNELVWSETLKIYNIYLEKLNQKK